MLRDGGGILRFADEVRAVHVDLGLVEQEVRHDTPPQDRQPLHACRELADSKNGRIRMGVLHHQNITEVDGKSDRMKIQGPDLGGVPRHPTVHLALDEAAEGLVDKERRRNQDRNQHRSAAGHPRQPPSHTNRSGKRRARQALGAFRPRRTIAGGDTPSRRKAVTALGGGSAPAASWRPFRRRPRNGEAAPTPRQPTKLSTSSGVRVSAT